MVVENLRVIGDIPDEGGCDRFMTDRDTSERRCVGHDMSPSTNRFMTSGDTSERRCVSHKYEPKYKPMHDDERRHLIESVWAMKRAQDQTVA
jgi:hypothetical protein